MKISRIRLALPMAACAALATFAFPANAQELDPRMIQNWEGLWEGVIDRALGGYLERAAEGSMATLDDEIQEEALGELAQLLYSDISWNALGNDVVRNMQHECGDDVLSGMEPYFIGGDSSTISADIMQTYSQCAPVAMQQSLALVSASIESNLGQISAIHAKYGIEYP